MKLFGWAHGPAGEGDGMRITAEDQWLVLNTDRKRNDEMKGNVWNADKQIAEEHLHAKFDIWEISMICQI